MADPLELVCCYAREDEMGLNALLDHLKPLERVGEIRVWHDRQIEVGSEWNKDIATHLDSASIIILLISSSFMASDYCYSNEMVRALARQESGEARVVPVILRHCAWQITPIGKLQALPTDGKPISDRKSWDNEDTALLNVFEGIHTIIIELRVQALIREAEMLYTERKYPGALLIYAQASVLQQALREPLTDSQRAMLALLHQGKADIFYAQNRFDEALQSYDLALELDANLARSNERKGYILIDFQHYEEALLFLSRVIQQNPSNQRVPRAKLTTLLALKREQEALEFCEQILPRFPYDFLIQQRAAQLFQKHGKYEQALAAWEQAISLSPDVLKSYQRKVEVLATLQRYEEALDVYQKIEEFKTDDPQLALNKGHILMRLWRYQEALEAYDQTLKFNPLLAEARFGKRGAYEALANAYAVQARKIESKGGGYDGQFKLAHTLREHTSGITCLALSADAHTLVSGSHDRTIKIWNLASERKARLISSSTQPARDLALSPDGSLLAGCWADGTLAIWESETGSERFIQHGEDITSIAFSPEGNWLFSGCSNGVIKAWDTSGKLHSSSLTYKGLIARVSLSSSGTILASSGEDGLIKLWDLFLGKEIATFTDELPGPIWSLFFSPDARTLFSANSEQVMIWDIASKKVVFYILTDEQRIRCCALSANGRWLACGFDNAIKIWHLSPSYRATTEEPITLPTEPVRDLVLNHNGRILIGGLNDGTIKIWMRE